MYLYHSSAYRASELKPAYLITGDLVEWDNTESNKFLYAVNNKESSIDQGFASMLEHLYDVKRYVSHGSKILVYLYNKKIPDLNDIKSNTIYLYVINYDINDGWVKVNNESNNMTGEYKTAKIISDKSISRVEEITVKDFIANKKITFIPEGSDVVKW